LRSNCQRRIGFLGGPVASADEQSYPINLVGSACKVMGLPAVNGAIHIIGKTTGDQVNPGLADVTLMRDNVDGLLVCIAMDSTSSSVTSGSGSASGTHIASIGGANLEVENLGHIRVCNALSLSVRGAVTFFW
jgi:hypothetical protein